MFQKEREIFSSFSEVQLISVVWLTEHAAGCGWDVNGWGGKVWAGWGSREQALSSSNPSWNNSCTHTQPCTAPASALGGCFGMQERETSCRNQILAPYHSTGSFLSQVRSPAQLDFAAAREGEVEPAPEVWAPGRSILRSKAEGGWSKIPTFKPPSLALQELERAIQHSLAQSPTKTWAIGRQQSLREWGALTSVAQQACKPRISREWERYAISSLFLERRQTNRGKQNREPPGIHKEETKNMINRLDHYFLKMTYCSSCYISRFLLSLRIKILAQSKSNRKI